MEKWEIRDNVEHTGETVYFGRCMRQFIVNLFHRFVTEAEL